jgi:hypothetical protein
LGGDMLPGHRAKRGGSATVPIHINVRPARPLPTNPSIGHVES